MKKSQKKLSLSRETVARLDGRSLAGVAGGTDLKPDPENTHDCHSNLYCWTFESCQ